jgi:hypothetical protein
LSRSTSIVMLGRDLRSGHDVNAGNSKVRKLYVGLVPRNRRKQ